MDETRNCHHYFIVKREAHLKTNLTTPKKKVKRSTEKWNQSPIM